MVALAKSVYNWLSENIEDRKTDEWRWGVNFFWICYVGAAPGYPFDEGRFLFTRSRDIAPLAGEFIVARTKAKAITGRLPRETGATLIAQLVQWLRLKDKWVIEGVDRKEFRRISMNEPFNN